MYLPQARDPKAVMKIETLNATFQPAKIGNPYGLQITYLRDNSTRNIFVYHSDSKVTRMGDCDKRDYGQYLGSLVQDLLMPV